MLPFASQPHGATLSDSAWWKTFGNFLADSVSFRFPSRPSLAGSPLLPANFAHDDMSSIEDVNRSLSGRRNVEKECCGCF
jgi:hypothetical protein